MAKADDAWIASWMNWKMDQKLKPEARTVNRSVAAG
jgi:hypothetical protein